MAAAATAASAAFACKAVHSAPPFGHLRQRVGREGEQLGCCCKAGYEGAMLGDLLLRGEQQLGPAVLASCQALLLVALAGLVVLLVW
jgi:hypothetical protein